MNKNELMLAVLAAGERSYHTPVQIQKLLFLVEKNVADDLGGAVFEFVPYDYGPFDSSVYSVLSELEADGYIASLITPRGWKKYQLTDAGLDRGSEILARQKLRASNYIREVSNFVHNLSFSDLVSAVYKAYPEMKVNSVFKDL